MNFVFKNIIVSKVVVNLFISYFIMKYNILKDRVSLIIYIYMFGIFNLML